MSGAKYYSSRNDLIFSAKQKPTACGGGYVQLAMPVISVESRFQAGRRTGIQFC